MNTVVVPILSKHTVRKLLNILEENYTFDHALVLDKGYSDTMKYTLYHTNRPVYLLRIYPLNESIRCTLEHRYLHQHYQNGVQCQQPLTMQILPELNCCYLLLDYLSGEDGENVLPHLPVDEQYQQGRAAGQQLHIIHQVIPDEPIDWAKRRYNKYIQKKQQARQLDLPFYRQTELEQYIEQNVDLLCNDRVVFQHDDFHPANLIFENGQLSGIIDFSRFDWGDAWEEFFKLPKYTCEVSTPFACGQVDGYFQDTIPDAFWPHYNLYVALNQHATLIGGLQHHAPSYVLDKIRHTIETHDFAGQGPPAWYAKTGAQR